MKLSKRHPLFYTKYKDKIITNKHKQKGIVVGYCEFSEENTVLIVQEYTKKTIYSSLKVFIKYHGNDIKDFHGDESMSFFLFNDWSISEGYVTSIE